MPLPRAHWLYRRGASTVASGANLLGAMIGGTLRYVALITGYDFLLVIVAALYGLAFLITRTPALRLSV